MPVVLRVLSLKNSRRCAFLPFLLQKSRLRAQLLVRRKLRGPPEVWQGEFLKYTFDNVSLSAYTQHIYSVRQRPIKVAFNTYPDAPRSAALKTGSLCKVFQREIFCVRMQKSRVFSAIVGAKWEQQQRVDIPPEVVATIENSAAITKEDKSI